LDVSSDGRLGRHPARPRARRPDGGRRRGGVGACRRPVALLAGRVPPRVVVVRDDAHGGPVPDGAVLLLLRRPRDAAARPGPAVAHVAGDALPVVHALHRRAAEAPPAAAPPAAGPSRMRRPLPLHSAAEVVRRPARLGDRRDDVVVEGPERHGRVLRVAVPSYLEDDELAQTLLEDGALDGERGRGAEAGGERARGWDVRVRLRRFLPEKLVMDVDRFLSLPMCGAIAGLRCQSSRCHSVSLGLDLGLEYARQSKRVGLLDLPAINSGVGFRVSGVESTCTARSWKSVKDLAAAYSISPKALSSVK
ncbi:hypothetical protein THAOC_32053, partial [Thalassiosira oceanica]